MTTSPQVAILYNQPCDTTSPEEQDLLTQVTAVRGALRRLNLESIVVGCSLNLEAVRRRLQQVRPDVVFNLVESLGGTDRLMLLMTLLLDALELPYTGAPSESLWQTTNKLQAKHRLRQAGLPTPTCQPAWTPPQDPPSPVGGPPVQAGSRWIVKPIWEHASRGMEDDCVVAVADETQLALTVRQRERERCCPHFAEAYIEGREFNLSLLATERPDPIVLSPAEIDFVDFPPGKPRIVGYRAKWDPQSPEYHQTPRRFAFPPADQRLLGQLQQLSRRCWTLFGLQGCARVDFRVDPQGQPWILEVNANPCLSPDAGFAAALQQSGIKYDQAIRQILRNATSHREANRSWEGPPCHPDGDGSCFAPDRSVQRCGVASGPPPSVGSPAD